MRTSEKGVRFSSITQNFGGWRRRYMTRRLSLGLESNLAVGIATVAKDDQPPIFSAVTKSSAGQ